VQQDTKAEGVLCIADSWPGQMRTIWGDHERFEETYFSQYPGMYFTGDGCRRDEDGYYWITGAWTTCSTCRATAWARPRSSRARGARMRGRRPRWWAIPHDIKGQGIYAYVTLMRGVEPTDQLRAELSTWVRQEIGPIAKPDLIQWAPGLPKTRSGKIMRRILRKIAENDFGALGDISTLADPVVVEDLIQNRMNRGTE
jgi:acetyl-CoA synthetase